MRKKPQFSNQVHKNPSWHLILNDGQVLNNDEGAGYLKKLMINKSNIKETGVKKMLNKSNIKETGVKKSTTEIPSSSAKFQI